MTPPKDMAPKDVERSDSVDSDNGMPPKTEPGNKVTRFLEPFFQVRGCLLGDTTARAACKGPCQNSCQCGETHFDLF